MAAATTTKCRDGPPSRAQPIPRTAFSTGDVRTGFDGLLTGHDSRVSIDWFGAAGVFLRREALGLGYDDRAIARLVRSGEWQRIRRGAFVRSNVWKQVDAVGRHRLTARAVLLTAHPTAVLSHISAALEYGAPTWAIDLSEVHVTRTDGRPGRREAGVVHHHGALAASEVHLRNGLPVTSPHRACVEVATMTSVESSVVTTNWLLHQGTATREAIQEQIDRFRQWPHSLRCDLVLRLADSRCAWPGEARLSHLLWREHLPKPEPQYEVYDADGQLLAILDFAWPSLGVFLEFDGRIKYERLRRPGERIEDVILREKRREEQVCLRTGWVCIRVTWEDLARPTTTARRIRGILDGHRGTD